MPLDSSSAPIAAPPPVFGWARVRVVLVAIAVVGLISLPGWQASYALLILRLLLIGFALLLVFGLFERWPARLPAWIARWTLQVVAVAVVVPFLTAIVYALTTYGDPAPWYKNAVRLQGYSKITMLCLLAAPWIAMSALYRHVSGQAQRHALALQLERSEHERAAAQARLQLLQAQVEPHFLFNTLANVRELVDSGSAQASTLLGSLIAYLRAAVPRLQQATTTLGEEIDLVRSYLEVMQMRMPDRLRFEFHIGAGLDDLVCPPTAVLTLVENAVRHGIDPSEQGGRIEIRIAEQDGRCRIQVLDSGIASAASSTGLGTGLATLRERLQQRFGGDAQLRLVACEPQGTRAELEFPAQRHAS